MYDFLQKFALTGKVAWVTGASYGLGFAYAKAFAEVMTNEGFNTTTGSNERYVINCDVMYDESQSSDGKTKFYNYTVTASLKDTSIGEELIPLSFTGREGSPTIENAKQRARNTIVNKIKQNFKVQFQKYLQSSAI